MLDIWPPIPIVLWCHRVSDLYNIIPALEHNDRVRKIELPNVPYWQMGSVAAVMHGPFPELIYLSIVNGPPHVGPVPDIPDSFLSGSAPRLQFLELDHIPFPGLPKLLLSAGGLVRLRLTNVPPGCIPPEEMVTALSAMTRLKEFRLAFESIHGLPAFDPESLHSLPDRESQRIRSPMCSVLPALTTISFKGTSEYFEDLVAWIDAPQINELYIYFYSQRIFNIPHLSQLVNHTAQ
jgi:hypothetical protein